MACSDWSFPSYYTRFLPITLLHVRELRQNCDARGRVRTQNPKRSAPNYYVTFSMMSYNHRYKGATTNLYGGTDNMAAFVLHWLFNCYFLVQLLATSLKAVSNRVESSYALPPYQSPRRHDCKNTTLHIPAFDSIFAAFFRAANSFTS